MSPNYQNGKIYKIYCNETDEVYYGSTTVPVSKRVGQHRSNFKEYQNKYVSPQGKTIGCCGSFQIIERGNYGYSLVENYPCNSKEELHAREGWWILNNDCINKIVAGRSWGREERKAHREENKEEMNEKNRKYREKNKDEINRKARESKFICPHCLTWGRRSDYTRHTRSKTHIKNAEKSQSNMID